MGKKKKVSLYRIETKGSNHMKIKLVGENSVLKWLKNQKEKLE